MTNGNRNAIIVALVIIFALATFGIYRLYKSKTDKPNPLPTPTPITASIGFNASPLPPSPKPSGSQPVTGPSDEFPNIGILVTSPKSGETVGSPVKIQGFANLPSQEVSIVVKDVYSTVLGIGKASACFAKIPCAFSASVVFKKPQTQTGTIEVFSPSSQNGSKEYLQTFRVNF